MALAVPAFSDSLVPRPFSFFQAILTLQDVLQNRVSIRQYLSVSVQAKLNLPSNHSVLTLVVSFVSAITINAPKNLVSGGPATITWADEPGDPSTFSIELLNTAFHNSFAIANNVNASAGSVSLDLPSVPAGDGYTVEAVDIR